MALAVAAGEVVAAALESKLVIVAEADGGVRAVELLLDDQGSRMEVAQLDRAEVLVPWLQPRALDVMSSGVLGDGLDGQVIRMAW